MNKIIVYILIIIPIYTAPALAYTDNQIADAIYKAEASKAHPYGIMQHYKTTTARQACINTIKHRAKLYNGTMDAGFILYLSKSYAPIGAGNDPKHLNNNWYKNVMHFLNQAQNRQ